MTIRDRLTLRFTALVSSILLLVFVSIYAFCWYFIAQDFYRRLDRKAATTGDMLIRHRLDANLIGQLSRIRRDQLPNQKIMAFDALAGLFGLSIVITALAGRIFAGDALRPMQQTDRTLGHIFPKNRDERLPVRAEPDEISRLSGTINRLLDRVAGSFRLQRLFVANVSHELKNPLTQISSQLEVSLLNQREPETYRQTIRSVLDDVHQLSALTHELLQLSQVNQDDAPDLLTDTVRVDELAWDIRDAVAAINPRYRVTVELGTLPEDTDGLTLPGNKTLLCTALKNLTENACKFSDDGHALIRVGFAPTGVQIDVQNNGNPIPEADLPYIFEPFYRSRQTADQVRGYGVGLSLVERIVRLHGGQISVNSQASVPTTFRIALPR